MNNGFSGNEIQVISQIRQAEINEVGSLLGKRKSVLLDGVQGVEVSVTAMAIARNLCNKPLGRVVFVETLAAAHKDFLKEIMKQLELVEFDGRGKAILPASITAQTMLEKIFQYIYSSDSKEPTYFVIGQFPNKVYPQVISSINALMDRGFVVLTATDNVDSHREFFQKFQNKVEIKPFTVEQSSKFVECLLTKESKVAENSESLKQELFKKTGGRAEYIRKAITDLPVKITAEAIKAIPRVVASTTRYLYLWFSIPFIILLMGNRYLIYYSSWSRPGKILAAIGFLVALAYRFLIYGWIKKKSQAQKGTEQ